MKPEGVFIAERVAAQHDRELLRGGVRQADPIKDLDRMGARVAELIAPALSRLCAGRKLAVRAVAAAQFDGSDALIEKLGPNAAINLVTAGESQAPLILSLPARTVIAFVDLAYGGNGDSSAPVPEKLSTSAMLMAERMMQPLSESLAGALAPEGECAIQSLCNGTDPELLAPFAECNVAVLSLEIGDGSRTWEAVLGFPAASMAELFRNRGRNGAVPAKGNQAASPRVEPFAGIPLPLRAVLVDMAVPVSLLSQLKPGQILPVAVARNVPLMAGEHVIAHGTVGALDDRAALQLTQITGNKEN
ncbi:MAG: FliM/FliN family flagellar motor switch protein [Novosphingobium sp.]